MLQVAQTTDALSLSPAVSCGLTFEDLENISYSPRLLLPVSLPAVIMNDPAYVAGCEIGFDVYFENAWFYENPSFPALKEHILGELFPGPADDAPLSERIGSVHGFLSVLAFTDRALALAGLDILTRLTDHLIFLSSGACV